MTTEVKTWVSVLVSEAELKLSNINPQTNILFLFSTINRAFSLLHQRENCE